MTKFYFEEETYGCADDTHQKRFNEEKWNRKEVPVGAFLLALQYMTLSHIIKPITRSAYIEIYSLLEMVVRYSVLFLGVLFLFSVASSFMFASCEAFNCDENAAAIDSNTFVTIVSLRLSAGFNLTPRKNATLKATAN